MQGLIRVTLLQLFTALCGGVISLWMFNWLYFSHAYAVIVIQQSDGEYIRKQELQKKIKDPIKHQREVVK